MKSIKQKLLVSFLVLVAAASLLCGGMGCISNYVSAKSTMVQMLEMTVGVASKRVQSQLEVYETAASSLGMVPGLSSAEKDNAFKSQTVQQWANQYGMERGNLLDASGYSFMDGNNYADRDYFQRAMAGETYVSTPAISKVTGELTVIVAAPLWQNGIQGSTVVGVVYLVPPETFLVDIMKSLLVSENGNAYMIDSSGYTIADTVLENIAVENIEEDAKTDPDLEELAALNAEMRQGKTGVGSYEYNGVKNKMLAYTPVEGTDGWSIAITAPASDFLGTTYKSIAATIILMVVVLVAAVLVSIRIARGIGGPVKACADRLALLQTGDLSSPVPVYDSQDEIGVLSRGTNIIVTALKEVIEDVAYLLKEMSSGNFAVVTRNPEVYKGERRAAAVRLHQRDRQQRQEQRPGCPGCPVHDGRGRRPGPPEPREDYRPAQRHGRHSGRAPGDQPDHLHHREHRLPDQHPGPQRRRGGRPCGHVRQGLCGGGRRSA